MGLLERPVYAETQISHGSDIQINRFQPMERVVFTQESLEMGKSVRQFPKHRILLVVSPRVLSGATHSLQAQRYLGGLSGTVADQTGAIRRPAAK